MKVDGIELTDYQFWTLVASREIDPRDASRPDEPPSLVELWREVVLAAWAVMMWRSVSRDPACSRVHGRLVEFVRRLDGVAPPPSAQGGPAPLSVALPFPEIRSALTGARDLVRALAAHHEEFADKVVRRIDAFLPRLALHNDNVIPFRRPAAAG
jgi:hypothetical protein